jgi:hypothetical protein
MAPVEWRRRVVLEPKLKRLRDFRSCEFGDDVEREVDSRRDSTRGKEAITHKPLVFVRRANQRQQIHVSPVRRGPTPSANLPRPEEGSPCDPTTAG